MIFYIKTDTRTFVPYYLMFNPMKRKQLVFSLLFCLLACTTGFSQINIICVDLVQISLDTGCTHTIGHEEVLEGSFCMSCDYLVEIDKTPPFGNGPWSPGVLGVADMGKTYQVRVTELSSTNKCWGNLKVVQELECTGLTTVNLPAGAPVTLLPGDLQINFAGNCFPINSAASTVNNGQPFVTYDCDDLGVHILQVKASDANGNTATCFTTVVVDDPDSECDSCITCPPATNVSFEQGGSVLLPAFQSGNWAAFDGYGDAAYNPACSYQDSVYWVESHTSPYGQNWFVRHWQIKDDGGQVTGDCEQVITFPFYQNISVTGKVFLDSIPDCLYNPGESPATIFNVVATKLPSNEQVATTPDASGNYSFDLTINGLDSIIEIRYALPNGLYSSCPTVVEIPATTTVQQHTFDIGLHAEGACPLLQVSIDGALMRRCFDNVLYVQYCNFGFIAAEDAYVEIEFDTLLVPGSSTIPWSTVSNNVYTFPVGDVPPMSCGTFQVTAALSCAAELGQTICTDATVFPHEPCGGASWDGPYVETQAYCDGDTVFLSVWNTGAQPMATERSYIVIEDVVMHQKGNFQLDAGDSTTVKIPANGSTWRVEAEQMADYPFPDYPSAAIEGCNGLNTSGLINVFPPNEEQVYHDVYCAEVRGSYDPNDKSAVPSGYGQNHTIRPNRDIEYKIRFQNTGTDTAFRVVIVDTLPAGLNPATVEAGASSHTYRLDVYSGGILHFVFDPIMLPDSNVNETDSHGFVTFSVAQQPDLPNGTVISNQAAIYFDFNAPVITNAAWHTIGEPFVTVQVDDPLWAGVRVKVRPNPFNDFTRIELDGVDVKNGFFTLFDVQGRVVRTQTFQGNQVYFQREQLQQGLYFFRISAGDKPVVYGKVQAH